MRPMNDAMLEQHLENLNRGIARVEQVLPTLATKDEIQNLDGRLASVEQILPTLATKEELRAAVAPLATKDELRSAIADAVAPLATKEEIRELRRHMDVLHESQHSDIQLVAEHIASASPKRSGD
jgi:alkylhydroperoxidase/carboxymuconolactone decarboxylase family protein YurZ